MYPEQIRPQVNRSEILKPTERFDILFDLMMRYADGESGWLTLPQIKVTVSREEDSADYAQFFLFAPKPAKGYETARYSPSITMVEGFRIPVPCSGKFVGESKLTHIKKSFLDEDENSPYHRKYYQSAAADLTKLESVFFHYKTAIETSGSTELN